MRFTNTITIDRRPAAVFAYLADPQNLPQWNYAIRGTRKLTAGPVGVGARYEQTRSVPVHSEETFEVVEFEPNHKLTIRGTLNSLPAQVSYTLRPDGDATTVTNTVELRPAGPLSLLAPLVTPRIKSAVAANLDVLKRTLERA